MSKCFCPYSKSQFGPMLFKPQYSSKYLFLFFHTHTGLELVWVNNYRIFTFVWTTFKLWIQLFPDATFITHCFSTDWLIELGRIQPTVTHVVTVPASYTGESLILYLNLSAWPTFLYLLNYNFFHWSFIWILDSEILCVLRHTFVVQLQCPNILSNLSLLQ